MDDRQNQMIPYIVDGEILQINEIPAESDSGAMAVVSKFAASDESFPVFTMVTYVCKVTLYNGAVIILPNVIDSSPFGGIDDYMQIRRRASEDVSGANINCGSDLEAQIGDRVLIAFINGSINQPIIIACMQHPLQVPRFEEGISPDTKPQMFWRYLGISQVIDEDGQMFVTHFGAPKIKYTGSVGLAGALAGALGSAAGAASALSSGYEGYEEGDVTLDGPESKAVEPQDFRYKTTYEFLKNGMWRVRDSIGQNLIIDPEKSQIVITNTGIKSTDAYDGGMLGSIAGALGGGEDAEVIRLDAVEQSILINSRALTKIFSGDAREDTTGGDYSHDITGDETISITGDQTVDVYGSVTRSIVSDLNESVTGSVTWDITGDFSKSVMGAFTIDATGAISISTMDAFDISITSDYTVDCKGNIAISALGDISILDLAGSGIKISSGKVEIGGKAAGLFDSVLQIEAQIEAIIDAIMQMTVPTGTGPSGPPMNAAAFVQVKTQLAMIKGKLSTVKGSL